MTRNNLFINLLLFLSIIAHFKCWSQTNIESKIDSIYTLEFEELSKIFLQKRQDTLVYKNYANAYLDKAKTENDIIKQSDGLYLLGLISDENNAIKYADSIITLTENLDNYAYPARGYLLKARNLGRIQHYQEALDQLLKANHYAKRNGNTDQEYQVRYFIGVLKVNLGELESSLDNYKATTKYYRSKYQVNIKYKRDYLKSLFALSNGYMRLNRNDSAYNYMNQGMKLALKLEDSIYYGYFLLSSGIILYQKRDYKSSEDSLIKFKRIFQYKIKDANVNIANLYLGKTYYETNETEKAIRYLEKVDSIPPIRLRSCYELLLKIYKERRDLKNQVKYIDKILITDSLITRDFKYLYKNIAEKYSTPILILEKEKIINSLETNRKNNLIKITILCIALVLISIILYYNNHKRNVYKKRFEKLYSEQNILKGSEKKEIVRNTEDIGIPKEIVDDIISKLDSFEERKLYLSLGLTISELAKTFDTNSRYLSKVVNTLKQKSFSNYLNDLRIDYVIEELKNNEKFRKYTIKAISNEIGFNSSEVFSKQFYKRTGLYPSFYIKNLKKKYELQ